MARKSKPKQESNFPDGFLFCAMRADLIFELETPARRPECKWFLSNTLPKWQRDDVRACLVNAASCWPTVAGVTAEEVTSEGQADLIIRCVNLGGPYGVLADCELPGPKVQHMRLDTSEEWTVKLGADVPQNMIDLNRVVRHEWGHYWGMGHAPQGSPNLMAPTYSRSIWEPKSWEIQQMTKAYGQPKAPPPDLPPPTTPGGDEPDLMVIRGKSGKVTAKFRLTRIPLSSNSEEIV